MNKLTGPLTYLFYDIESSGLSKPFDQVMQFAAIRTDADLNELERHEIFVRLNPDLIPSPYACITHRIHPSQCEAGLSEDQALLKIHTLMNTPGTISLGYNTLSFDDEFLRFSFYRNLLSPYTHQWANQCGRMDLYPMLLLYYLYQPEILKWPMIDGRPSMKLENIGLENGFLEGSAHNAMVDVEATVALAKILKSAQSRWEYLLGCFQKKTDQERLDKLSTVTLGGYQYLQGLYILPKLGNRVLFQAPVIHLGIHRHYKNQTVWLRLDLPELRDTDPLHPEKTAWVLNKKLGEPGIILPLHDRFIRHLQADRLSEVSKNIAYLSAHPAILTAIKEYYLEYKHTVHPKTDVEAGLYQAAFWSPEETRWCQRFHETKDPAQKYQIMHQMRNKDLKSLALRLLARHYPEVLNSEEREIFEAYLAQDSIFDFKGELKRTQAVAQQELSVLPTERVLDPAQSALLSEWAPRVW